MQHIEIACDESGFSGGNLVGGGHSPVFAHASVRIESEAADELIQHLRRKSARAATVSTSRRKSCGRVDDHLCCGCSAPAVPSTAANTFTSRTPACSFLPAWSTCFSAGSRCAGSPAQDGALTPNRWRSPFTGRASKAMEPPAGRSSSLCRPISSAPTTGGCQRRQSRCSTRRSRR